MFRWIKRIVPALVLLVVAGWLHHYLPQHDIVRINGTDVVRFDDDTTTDAQGNVISRPRDVYLIRAKTPGDGTRTYRNEDTGWGFPFYFKFDSSNLQTEAQDLVSTQDSPRWVVVTHYGWRITYFSKFPNATSIRPASGPDELIVPWFNIVFLSALALMVLWIVFRLWRFKEERVEPFLDDTAEEASGLWSRLRRSVTGR
jgi:hypothetical protein